MRRVIYFLSAVLLTAEASFGAKVYTYTPVLQSEQTDRYVEGVHLIISVKTNVCAIAVRLEKARKLATFLLSVINNSDESFNVGTDGIKVFNKEGVPLRVYSASEISAMIRKNAAQAELAGALRSVGSSLQSTANSYGNTDYNTYGLGQAAEQSIIRRETQENIASIMSLEESVFSKAFKKHTILPGLEYEGFVYTDYPKIAPNEISVIVNLGGENHEFKFSVDKVKRKKRR